MFDFSFFELALIFVIALVVLGPDKLPSAARTVGRYVGRARRMLSEVKADIKREIDEEELRKIRSIGDDLKAAQREVTDTGRKIAGVAESEVSGESAPGRRTPRRTAGSPVAGAAAGADAALDAAPGATPAPAAESSAAATPAATEGAGQGKDRPDTST